jgi:hypothetical protein
VLQCSTVATVKPANFLHAPGQGQGSLGPGYAPGCVNLNVNVADGSCKDLDILIKYQTSSEEEKEEPIVRADNTKPCEEIRKNYL